MRVMVQKVRMPTKEKVIVVNLLLAEFIERKILAGLWRCPSTSNLNPLVNAAAIFALNFRDIRITFASAAYPVLLDGIGIRPVFILLDALLLILRRHFQVRNARQLSCRSVGRTVLDRRVSVPNVPEIVHIARRKKSASSKRMNRSITPL